jgi:hypothetical protein
MHTRFILGGVAACAFGLATAGTIAVGQSPRPPAAAPTFSKDVAPIFYRNCTVCHRPGEIAPMSLLTYQDARPWARSIRDQVSRGAMPPWYADPAHGRFLNDRRLSDADKDIITRWANGGAPEGDPADRPAAPRYADGWMMGQPDIVLGMNEDYPVPAEGTVEYKYFEVPTNFAEDTFIQAMEVRPGNRAVVHHVILYARPPQPEPRPAAFKFAPGMEVQRDDEADAKRHAPANDRPAPRRLGPPIGGFAPGQFVREYNPGTAVRVPAGAVLVFQMHYTANGAATTDRTTVGLRLMKEKPKDEVRMGAIINGAFTIPAGASDYRVDAEATVQQDLIVWSLLPHTHVRGKRWTYDVTYPDGRTETILAVPRYNFNWQTDYIFKEPMRLARGTKIHATAWYDNSRNNPSNPDPSVDVKWGDQTWEEMMFTAINYTVVPAPAPPTGEKR